MSKKYPGYEQDKEQLSKAISKLETSKDYLIDDSAMKPFQGQVHAVFPLLDLLFDSVPKASKVTEESELTPYQSSCLAFLGLIFCEIRYKLDLGESSAIKCSKECQKILIKNAKRMNTLLINEIFFCFRESLLPVSEELKNALFNRQLAIRMNENEKSEQPTSKELTPDDEDELIKAAEGIESTLSIQLNSHDLFTVAEELSRNSALAPSDIILGILFHLYFSSNPKIRSLVVLFLLSESREVRDGVSIVLLQAPENLSGIDLRRLITINSWLPEEERGPIEQIIDQARAAGVKCSSFEPVKILELYTSMFDGSGVQVNNFYAKSLNDKFMVTFLCKEATGIREPMCVLSVNRSIFRQHIENFRRMDMNHEPTKISYVQKIVPHYLATGVKHGKIPELGTLQLVELLGECWQPKLLDPQLEIEQLKASLRPTTWTGKMRTENLELAGELLADPAFFSWFEVGDAVKPAIKQIINKEIDPLGDQAREIVCKKTFEPLRESWLNKILCSALRDYHLEKPNPRWILLATVADEILKGVRLSEIDFFLNMATKTLVVFLHNQACNKE